MRIASVRAARKKGFFQWMHAAKLDIVCLQETRAHMEQIPDAEYCPEDFHCIYRPALRRGYSGVAIFSKQQPEKVVDVMGLDWADDEGRFLLFECPNLRVASLYLPSGSHNPSRQVQKYAFMEHCEKMMRIYLRDNKPLIICGDYNIVHKEIDIKNFTANQKNSGCLPEERAWLDKLFGEVGLVDAFRIVNQEAEQYTWWSNRGGAYANNVGWRIDYQVISRDLADKVQSAQIYKDERFSDHAPLIVDYSL